MTTTDTLATIVLAQEGGAGSTLGAFLPLIIIIGIFWFLIMRPQQRRQREHRELVSGLKQGDKVVAAGGLVGTIRRVDDDLVTLQCAENVVLKVDKSTVVRRVE